MFDPDSIMLYAFPAQWTTNGVATHANDVLSSLDKEFIAGAAMYPRTGTLPAHGAGRGRRAGPMPTSAPPARRTCSSSPRTRTGVYQVDTRGHTDVYMKLFGPDSPTALIDEDDDSGYGQNPRISAPLLAGDYFVQVRHYDNSGTGTYSIGVTRR